MPAAINVDLEGCTQLDRAFYLQLKEAFLNSGDFTKIDLLIRMFSMLCLTDCYAYRQ